MDISILNITFITCIDRTLFMHQFRNDYYSTVKLCRIIYYNIISYRALNEWYK